MRFLGAGQFFPIILQPFAVVAAALDVAQMGGSADMLQSGIVQGIGLAQPLGEFQHFIPLPELLANLEFQPLQRGVRRREELAGLDRGKGAGEITVLQPCLCLGIQGSEGVFIVLCVGEVGVASGVCPAFMRSARSQHASEHFPTRLAREFGGGFFSLLETALKIGGQRIGKLRILPFGFLARLLFAHGSGQVQRGHGKPDQHIGAAHQQREQQNEADERQFRAPGRVDEHDIARVIAPGKGERNRENGKDDETDQPAQGHSSLYCLAWR